MIHVLLTEKKASNSFCMQKLLEKEKEFNIVGVTENSIEVLYALIQNRVDVMIIDKSIASISESDCAGMVSKLNIDVKILLLLEDVNELPENWNPDLYAGYVLRSFSHEEILKTIMRVMNTKSEKYFIKKGEFALQVAVN